MTGVLFKIKRDILVALQTNWAKQTFSPILVCAIHCIELFIYISLIQRIHLNLDSFRIRNWIRCKSTGNPSGNKPDTATMNVVPQRHRKKSNNPVSIRTICRPMVTPGDSFHLAIFSHDSVESREAHTGLDPLSESRNECLSKTNNAWNGLQHTTRKINCTLG